MPKLPSIFQSSPFQGYQSGDEIPLGSYAAILGVYSMLLGTFIFDSAKNDSKKLRSRDLILLAVATHKISRAITKGAVTAPLRAPFSTYKEDLGYGEINDNPRGTGFRQVVGELLTCNYCMNMWVGLGALAALQKFPKHSRILLNLFAAVAGADFLHVLYEAIRTQENLLTIEEELRENHKGKFPVIDTGTTAA